MTDDTSSVPVFHILPEDISQAEHYSTLGPVYFAARRMAEGLFKNADEQPFKDVAAKASELVRDAVYEYVETHLLGDLECNVQGHVYRLVDETVSAILHGEDWAIARYSMAGGYNGDKIRRALAQYAGDNPLKLRIDELEAETKRLREALDSERRWAR